MNVAEATLADPSLTRRVGISTADKRPFHFARYVLNSERRRRAGDGNAARA